MFDTAVFPPKKQSHPKGVVMIVALILLMVVSMLSVFTIRQATSSTQVSNNARTQTTAMQAAEIALKTCVNRVQNFLNGDNPSMTPSPAPAPGTRQLWEPVAGDMTQWDGQGSLNNFPAVPPTNHFSLVLTANDTGTMLKRFPECIAEYQTGSSDSTIIVTARGFGPEVAAVDRYRSRPVGTEVWLQSLLVLD